MTRRGSSSPSRSRSQRRRVPRTRSASNDARIDERSTLAISDQRCDDSSQGDGKGKGKKRTRRGYHTWRWNGWNRQTDVTPWQSNSQSSIQPWAPNPTLTSWRPAHWQHEVSSCPQAGTVIAYESNPVVPPPSVPPVASWPAMPNDPLTQFISVANGLLQQRLQQQQGNPMPPHPT
eukprot:6492774-Amphidinium_carterae.3